MIIESPVMFGATAHLHRTSLVAVLMARTCRSGMSAIRSIT